MCLLQVVNAINITGTGDIYGDIIKYFRACVSLPDSRPQIYYAGAYEAFPGLLFYGALGAARTGENPRPFGRDVSIETAPVTAANFRTPETEAEQALFRFFAAYVRKLPPIKTSDLLSNVPGFSGIIYDKDKDSIPLSGKIINSELGINLTGLRQIDNDQLRVLLSGMRDDIDSVCAESLNKIRLRRGRLDIQTVLSQILFEQPKGTPISPTGETNKEPAVMYATDYRYFYTFPVSFSTTHNIVTRDSKPTTYVQSELSRTLEIMRQNISS
jgi:hypothetical protein